MKIAMLSGLLLSLVLCAGCRSHTVLAEKAAELPPSVTLKTARGQSYLLKPTAEKDRYKQAFEKENSGDPNEFIGKGRTGAKTQLANAPLETYKNLWVLLTSLPGDESMLMHDPAIGHEAKSPRVAEEEGNIQVKVWLFAVKRDPDNSYRLILGSYPTSNGASFMSAIVSALPPSGSQRATLQQVRRNFEKLFAPALPTTAGYQLLQPAMPVLVTGSLYFDTEHSSTMIGPPHLHPQTAWELRPLTEIIFEP